MPGLIAQNPCLSNASKRREQRPLLGVVLIVLILRAVGTLEVSNLGTLGRLSGSLSLCHARSGGHTMR